MHRAVAERTWKASIGLKVVAQMYFSWEFKNAVYLPIGPHHPALPSLTVCGTDAVACRPRRQGLPILLPIGVAVVWVPNC